MRKRLSKESNTIVVLVWVNYMLKTKDPYILDRVIDTDLRIKVFYD